MARDAAFQGKEASVHLSEFTRKQRSGWLTDQEKEDWTDWRNTARSSKINGSGAASGRRSGHRSKAPSSSIIEEDEGTIRRFEKFLPGTFIASAVELKEAIRSGLRSRLAGGKKCQRCWQIKQDVGSNDAYPIVCGRCGGVLDELAVGKA